MSSKYWVWGGGRWRELELAHGRVEGWGRVRFVRVSGARLQLLRRAAVLRALRALAAPRAAPARGAAHDGPRLPQLRYELKPKHKAQKRTRCHECQRPQCCAHCNTCARDRNCYALLQQASAAPCHVSVQCLVPDTVPRYPPALAQPHCAETVPAPPKHQEQYTSRLTQSATEQPYKELEISEDDVMIIRSFIENDERNIFKVDLELFDSDDNYKSMVFYKLHPLVTIERSKEIKELLHRQVAGNISVKDFMSTLGLRSLDEASTRPSKYRMRPRRPPRTISDSGDKENISNQVSKKAYRSRRTRSSMKANETEEISESESESGSGGRRARLPHERPNTKRTSQNSTRVTNSTGEPSSAGRRALRSSLPTTQNRQQASEHKRDLDAECSKPRSEHKRDVDAEFSKPRSEHKRQPDVEHTKLRSKHKRTPDVEHTTSKLRATHKEQTDTERTTLRSEHELRPTARAAALSEERVQARERPKLNVNAAGRGGAGGAGRAYSEAEDEALVRLVAAGARARRVNGNALWRELEPEFCRAVGRSRSWHSLRNRYLRYVLPALGRAAPPGVTNNEVVRLRAQAAQGEIKGRKILKRNSLFSRDYRPVQSAWARRPRAPAPPETPGAPETAEAPSGEEAPDPEDPDFATNWKLVKQVRAAARDTKSGDRRALRSSVRETPPAPHVQPRMPTPTYSDITRRFAQRPQRSSLQNSSTSGGVCSPSAGSSSGSHHSEQHQLHEASDTSSSASSRVSHRSSSDSSESSLASLQAAGRRQRSLRSSAAPPPEAPRAHKRRLYTPAPSPPQRKKTRQH